MSIRLRLTLLYSVILALTLIAFGTTLYVIQAKATLDAITTTLARQVEGLANAERRFPRRSDETPFSGTLPGRWTQTRDADGTVSARTADLSDTTLPLSDAGLRAVQNGSPWVETAQVEDVPLLIYSQPVIVQDRVTRIVQVAAPVAEREHSLNTLRLILITASGLTILAAFAVGWALAGMALRPIHQITHTAQVIGAERNFSHRVQHEGPNDEVGQLATTFNTMLTELESAYRQVEQALQMQRRFVADASHELRTPLTTIRGNVELLRHEPPIDANEQAEVLADTKDEAERLIRLVNQLLLLARADAGRPLRREPVAIKPLIEDVCRQTKLLAPHRTITLDASLDVAVLCDRDALKQVLLILLDNALVHTPRGATINVTTAIADQQVAICVRDTGLGITPSVLPHIFERFYRADVSRTGRSTGLGLSIAKELVEAQDGALTVESQVGQGSVFTVTLPQAVG
jgi:signal transduction histidine kinase